MGIEITDEQVTRVKGLIRLVNSLQGAGAAGYDDGFFNGQAAVAETLVEMLPFLAEDDEPVDLIAECPICQEPIDYCQGHGAPTDEQMKIYRSLSEAQWNALNDVPEHGYLTPSRIVSVGQGWASGRNHTHRSTTIAALLKRGLIEDKNRFQQFTLTDLGRVVSNIEE